MMNNIFDTAHRLGSLKNPAEILDDLAKFGIRVPLTPAQFALLKDFPLGLMQRICGNWVMEALVVEFIKHNKLLEELATEMDIYYFAGVDDSEDEIEEEEERMAELAPETIEKVVNPYSKALENYYEAHSAYDAYVKNIPEAWHALHVNQINTSLTPAINRFLATHKMVPLQKTELPVLQNIAKPAEILARMATWESKGVSEALPADTLSMPKPTPENVKTKVEINLNIALMRILTARETNVDPQTLDTVLPSIVKKWQDKKMGMVDIISNYITTCEAQDAVLMEEQQEKLDELSKEINKLKTTVINCEKPILDLRSQFAALTAKLLDQLQTKDTAVFLQQLENVYHGADNAHNATEVKNKAFNFRLTRIIKRLSRDEAEKFLARIESHKEYLQNNAGIGSTHQHELFATLLNIKHELMEDETKKATLYQTPKPTFPKQRR